MNTTIVRKRKKPSKRIPELEKQYGKSIEDIIKEYYLDKHYGIVKISKELHLSIKQVYDLLEKANIETRHEFQPNDIQREKIAEKIRTKFNEDPAYKKKISDSRKKYFQENPEAKEQIKKQLETLRTKNIERLKTDEDYRNRQLSGILEDAKNRTKLHKEELYDLYWNQELSMFQIAKKLGMHVGSVQIAMSKYNIPVRNVSEYTKLALSNPEIREKMSLKQKQSMTEERKKHMSQIMSGENNHFYGKTHTEESKEKILKAVCRSPNLSETKLDSIIQKNFPNTFKYVGDASITIHGLSVDFIWLEKKKIIEFFGFAWHHSNNPFGKKIPYVRTEEGRKHILSKYGYELLVIWDYESEKGDEYVINKIKNFISSSST